MERLPNYIPDTNPFSLAGPPAYFQRQLWDYDPSLVIVPSRQGFFYRLAQRRKLNLTEKMVNDILKEQADTHMLARHGLIPVTTIMATVRWDNPLLFVELNRRAPWRMGGAKQFEKLILEQEHKEALDKKVAQDEMLTDIAKDSWRYYNKLIGTRSHLWTPTTPGTKKVTNLILPSSLQNYRPQVDSTWAPPKRIKG